MKKLVARSTKDRLLAVLAELADERPSDQIAIVDIAARAGVSRPTVVRHLGDKSTLRRLLEETRSAYAPQSTRERLVHAALIGWGQSGEGPPSIAELAAETGFAKSSIAWHFPRKADLLIATGEYLTGLYDTSGLWGGEGKQVPTAAAPEPVAELEAPANAAAPRDLSEGVEGLLRRRLELAKSVPRLAMALAWLRRAGPEETQTTLDRAERAFRRGVAAWLRALALRGELEPGSDIEAWVALLETLLRDLEQRPGQQSWPERMGALLVASVRRR